MYTINWTDNDEVIETHTARTMDEAVAKVQRMTDGDWNPEALKDLRAGKEITHDDCETVFITKAR